MHRCSDSSSSHNNFNNIISCGCLFDTWCKLLDHTVNSPRCGVGRRTEIQLRKYDCDLLPRPDQLSEYFTIIYDHKAERIDFHCSFKVSSSSLLDMFIVPLRFIMERAIPFEVYNPQLNGLRCCFEDIRLKYIYKKLHFKF